MHAASTAGRGCQSAAGGAYLGDRGAGWAGAAAFRLTAGRSWSSAHLGCWPLRNCCCTPLLLHATAAAPTVTLTATLLLHLTATLTVTLIATLTGGGCRCSRGKIGYNLGFRPRAHGCGPRGVKLAVYSDTRLSAQVSQTCDNRVRDGV